MTKTVNNWHTTSRQDYLDMVWDAVNDPNRRHVMEIGGTSSRSIGTKPLPDHVESYTIADISDDELAKVPDLFKTVNLDICGDVTAHAGRYDLIVSKFCGEHMPDGRRFHRNVATMLAEGGIAIHIYPTLFASPFVINRIIPENISVRIVRFFQPLRFVGSINKFPALYSFCRGGSEKHRNEMQSLGYSNVDIISYFGHHYYDKIPGLKHLENWISRTAERKNWNFYSSYAVVKLTK